MSALPARAATAGSLALALALALPAAAFADPDEADRDRKGSQSQGGDRSGERSEEQGRSETAPHGEGGADAQQQETSKRKDRTSAKGSADEGRAGGGDPRGNNGTIKIDGMPFDDGRGNEPHVGCTFQVDFYGFDAGDTASITFTGHAPTGGGLLHSETATPISDDAAGGGQDRDATLTYSVSKELSELLAIAPHPKQGWHVKLAVDVDSAPGGAKQKVFWIDCPQAPAAGSGTTEESGGSGGGTTGEGGTTTPTVSTQGAGTTTVLPATVVSGTTVAAAERQEALTLGSGTATLAGTQTSAAQGSAAGQTDVAAQGSVSPSALPFTGSQALLYLLALGLSAVGVGAIAHRMGRQQADLS